MLILGATGGTGIQIVEQAIHKGHSVTALVRSTERLARFNGRINTIVGDLMSSAEIASAASGHDAVLSALGPRDPKSKARLMDPFAHAVVNGMSESGVARLILLSIAFLFRNAILPPVYPLGQMLFKDHVRDCEDMESTVRASALNWTIVRPPQFTDKPATGKYRVEAGRLPLMGFTVSRADVADFMIRAAEQNLYSRQIVGLAN